MRFTALFMAACLGTGLLAGCGAGEACRADARDGVCRR